MHKFVACIQKHKIKHSHRTFSNTNISFWYIELRMQKKYVITTQLFSYISLIHFIHFPKKKNSRQWSDFSSLLIKQIPKLKKIKKGQLFFVFIFYFYFHLPLTEIHSLVFCGKIKEDSNLAPSLIYITFRESQTKWYQIFSTHIWIKYYRRSYRNYIWLLPV